MPEPDTGELFENKAPIGIADYEALAADHDDYSYKLAQSEELRAEREIELSQARAEIERLRGELSLARRSLDTDLAELQRLRAEYDELDDWSDGLQKKIEEQAVEVERLRTALPAPDDLEYAALILEEGDPGGTLAGTLRQNAKAIREIQDA